MNRNYWSFVRPAIDTSTLVLIALIPVLVSFDFGGVLPWTQYVAWGLLVAVAAVYSVATLPVAEQFVQPHRISARGLRPIEIPIGLVVAWALCCSYLLFQQTSLPAHWVRFLSNGSYQAYHEWMEPALEIAEQKAAQTHPISIHPNKTRHLLALLAGLLPLVLVIPLTLSRGQRVNALLLTIAVGTAAHALFGMFGGVSALGIEVDRPTSFGGFINRNNAALFLNLGIAASLGLLAERILHYSTTLSDDRVQIELGDLIRDAIGWIALICLAIHINGLFVCGSRGGLLAMFAGFCIAIPVSLRSKRVAVTVVTVVVPIAIAMAILFSEGVRFESLTRLVGLNPKRDVSRIVDSTRARHWQDGLDAAWNYLPAGSGGATYRNAYLPFQDLGENHLYVNADNLYLEWFVELGMPGLILMALLAGAICYALYWTHRSGEPLDQGLCVMGCFLLIAVAVSQITDFGLLIPANMLLVTILTTALLSHAAQHKRNLKFDRPGKLGEIFASVSTGRWTRPLCCLLAATVGTLSVVQLHAQAGIDHAAARAKAIFMDLGIETAEIERELLRIEEQIRHAADSDLYVLQAEYYFKLARIKEIESLDLADIQQLESALQKTRPGLRTLPAPTQAVRDEYKKCVGPAVMALHQNPLSVRARAVLVYTDFIHNQPRSSEEILRQVGRLQRQNGVLLVKLAEIAVHQESIALAEQFLLRATEVQPSLTPRVVEIAIRHSRLDLNRCLAVSPDVRLRGLLQVLSNPQSSTVVASNERSFIEASTALLDCDACGSLSERANCEWVTATANFLLNRPSVAVEHARKAIEFAPAQKHFRIELTRRLIQIGRIVAAREIANDAIKVFPNDPELLSLLRQTTDRE